MREIQRRKGLMKSRIQICVAYFSSVLCCSLCLCLSFLFSLCLCCVYICSLFLYLPSFFLFPLFSLFFFFPRVFLYLQRDSEEVVPFFFSQPIRSWSSFRQFFSSTIPNFKLSHDPLFSFWLFYLFRCFLSSFFLVGDSPTFRLLRPNFIKPCSLLSGDATSLFTFQIFYFILLDLFLSFSQVLGSRPLTWLLFLFSQYRLVNFLQMTMHDFCTYPIIQSTVAVHLSYCLVHSCHVNTVIYDTFYMYFLSFNNCPPGVNVMQELEFLCDTRVLRFSSSSSSSFFFFGLDSFY